MSNADNLNNRSCSIDIMRFVMALLIVALHTNPFAEYNALLSFFPSQVLSRFGVPFFAAVTGYFYFGTKPTSQKTWKIIGKYCYLYSIWSTLYLLFALPEHIGGGTGEILKYILRTFFFTGFYHLWYILAIIYTLIILWMIQRTNYGIEALFKLSFFLLFIGVVMFGYGKIFSGFTPYKLTFGKLDLSNNMETQWLTIVFPFFMLGYGLRKRIPRFAWAKAEILLAGCFVGYLIEIVFLEALDIKQSTTLCVFTYPTLTLILICLLKHPKIGNSSLAYYASRISSFVYFSHILFVLLLQRAGMLETPTFFITVVLSCTIGFFLVRSGNKYLLKMIG